MNKKILLVSILTVFMLATMSFASAVSTNIEKSERLSCYDNEELDQQQTKEDGYKKIYKLEGYYYQTFIPSQPYLTAIELKLGKSRYFSGMLEYQIIEMASMFAPERLLISGLHHSLLITEIGRWAKIDFDDIKVTPGNMYKIVCKTTIISQKEGYISWYYGTGDPYEKGQAYYDKYYQIETIKDVDFCFKTYGTGYIDSQPPEKPQKPWGESKEKTGEVLSLNTTTMDPEHDGVLYKWDWGDGEISSWIGPYQYESWYNHFAIHRYQNEGTYQVRVKAQDEWGHESPWSDSVTVNIEEKETSTHLLITFQRLYYLICYQRNLSINK